MSDDDDRTASLMTPARLAQLKVRPTPAASPSAWLDQLAADAGSGHVRRLLDLRRQLETQVGDPQYAAAGQACAELAAALVELDFSLLAPKGWLARATGKGKEAAAAFRGQAARCGRAGDALAKEVRALQQRLQAQAPALERSVVECEVEARAIQKIMDQGARWLQDMRNQLKARGAEGGDAAALEKIEEDTRRCELLVERLKRLRTADAAAVKMVEHCKAAAPRRAALAASLQQLDAGWKEASRQLDALAELAGTPPDAAKLDAARQGLRRLGEALGQGAADANALQSQDQALGHELAALQEPLQAAA
ncbi:hypothetical protein GCM10028796_45630 [Ramlibacter monticola]|uniref:Uncharacterized protein n=1 Tax=Ramlibacter monticola TaxID=1926872 RepID=A0A936Z3V3_9BURK|nr:hypothetical protein [Ramlibacter monticola]MBL0393160.1 hypothetical protein [Ramlibacter monticola]